MYNPRRHAHSPMSTEVPPGEVLHGWKEIAAHIGKSVRAAQRWERELGLPVRRLKTAAGQVVFARREELAAWQSANELLPAPRSRPDALAFNSKTILTYLGRVRFSLAAGLAVVALPVAAMFWLGRTIPGDPAGYRLVGSVLEAVDASGDVRWRYQFPAPLAGLPVQPSRPRLTRRVFSIDMDNDGTQEIIAVLSSGNEHVRRSDAVYCFDAKGQVRWTFEPKRPLQFKSRTYPGPFVIKDVAIIDRPDRPRLWLAIDDWNWWPGAVVELDSAGRDRLVFVQSGQVMALVPWRRGTDLRLIAAGVNNEYAAAALAVLDPDQAAASPQTPNSPYACVGCPAATPVYYILLPSTDLSRAEGMPYTQAEELDISNGEIQVSTKESSHGNAAVQYRFDWEFRVVSRELDDGFRISHERYSIEHRLLHVTGDCPELRSRELRIWRSENGWGSATTPAPAMPSPRMSAR